MNKQGIIKAVSISKTKGIPKSNVEAAELIKDFGIKSDAHAGKWHRQVSFLALESIDKMKSKGLPKLRPGAFAENITTELIDIPHLTIGSRIRLGVEAEVEITQIGKECHSKCAIYYRAGTCVMPTDGIFGIVTKSGKIFVNDKIEVL